MTKNAGSEDQPTQEADQDAGQSNADATTGDIAQKIADLWLQELSALSSDPMLVAGVQQWLALLAHSGVAHSGLAQNTSNKTTQANQPQDTPTAAHALQSFASSFPGISNIFPTGAFQAGTPSPVAAPDGNQHLRDELARRLLAIEQRLERLESQFAARDSGRLDKADTRMDAAAKPPGPAKGHRKEG